MATSTADGTQPTNPIAWDTTHQQKESVQVAAARETILTPLDKHTLLKARAQTLAREPERTAAIGPQLEVTEFFIANETYAIESTAVCEVSLLRGLTPLPCAPPFVLGIVNVRGRILPVVDVKQIFGLPEKQSRESHTVLITHADGMEVAILADAILGARFIPLSTMQPPLSTLTGVRAQYLKGITNEGVAVLDAQKLLAGTRLGMQE